MFSMRAMQYKLIVFFHLYSRNCKAKVKYFVLQFEVNIAHCGSSSVLSVLYILKRRFQWPRGVRSRSAATRLLRLWVRIPTESWMSVVRVVCCQSDRGLSEGLINPAVWSYRLWRVVVCDLETTWMRRSWPTGGAVPQKQTSNHPSTVLFLNYWKLRPEIQILELCFENKNDSFLTANYVEDYSANLQKYAYCLSLVNSKGAVGKVHPCTGTEALYRPSGP
jgi:hypothetical protein